MKRSHERLALAILGGAGIFAAGLSFLPARPAFIWNFSASAPIGLYRVLDRPWGAGDWVAIAPSASVIEMMLRYRERSGRSLLLKRVAATTDDEVCWHDGVVKINGEFAALALERSQGMFLPERQGCWRISEAEAFVLGNTSRSFDGRYFGPIQRSAVLYPIARVGF